MTDQSILMLFSGIGLYGSERANLEVASALQRQGFKVRIVVSSAPWGENMRVYLEERGFEYIPMPFLVIDQTKSLRGWFANVLRVLHASWLLLLACRKLKPDFLFCGTQLALLSFLPALCLIRVPLVYRSGDAPILHNGVFRLSWRWLVWKCHRYVAVSHFIRRRLIEHQVPQQQVRVIYSKPPVRSGANQNIAERQHDLNPKVDGVDLFVVTFVGQIREQKGVALLVEAVLALVAEHPRVHLKFAGRVSDWEGDQWAVNFKQQVLGDPVGLAHVTFLGFVEDVPSLIRSSDVVVVPTLTQEPLANVVFEAKLASKPVIVFSSGGLPEVINHEVDGLICEDKTAQALALSIRRYLEDKPMKIRHGEASLVSLEQFGTTTFDQDWADVFQDVSGG